MFSKIEHRAKVCSVSKIDFFAKAKLLLVYFIIEFIA